MHRNGPRRPSVSSPRPGRRKARFRLEVLESRRLLATTVTPAVGPISAIANVGSAVTFPIPRFGSFEPGQISVAYGFYLTSENGAGQTIAIVDAYHDPNIRQDLATFNAQYHLPASELVIQNQVGQTYNYPRIDAGWSLEIATDVEWAHAIAPAARILLVEANSTDTSDLMVAVQTAARQASVVSMSWGGSEFPGEQQYDGAAYFGKPNVTFIAATGDDGGAAGAEWPSVSPNVLGVGGTALYLSPTGSYGRETAWNASYSRGYGASGSTGGLSTLEGVPGFQGVLGQYNKRATPDVSIVGDPNTGMAVYNSVEGAGSTGWTTVGGTSVGAPIWAGLIARANQGRGWNQLPPLSSTQTLNLLYGLYNTNYGGAFHDITAGSTFAGLTGRGYDLATGLGTPIANTVIGAAAVFNGGTPAPAVAPVVMRRLRHPFPRRRHDIELILILTVEPPAPVAITSTTVATIGPPSNSTPAPPAQPLLPTTTVVATTIASLVRPPQPVARPSQEPRQLDDEEEPGRIPTPGPDLYIDPIIQPELKLEAPQIADATIPPAMRWESTVDEFFVEGHSSLFGTEIALPEAPALELETSTASLSSAFAAGVAVAVWSTWESRSRRTDTDRRRWMLPLDQLDQLARF